jgi:hypothetical protein
VVAVSLVCTMIEVLKISGLVTQEMIDTRIKQKTLKLEEWSNIFK